MSNNPKGFNDVLVGKANRDKALPTTPKTSLKLPNAALTAAAADDTQDFTSVEDYERKNRSAATSAAAASLRHPSSALTEEEQDNQGLVVSASYYENKSRQAAIKAATASISNSNVGDMYNARAQYKSNPSTHSGALSGAVNANRLSLNAQQSESEKNEQNRLSEHGSKEPSFDAAFLYDKARAAAIEDLYSANPALAMDKIANEEADRKNRASQAGIQAMANSRAEPSHDDGTIRNDMASMGGTNVHYVAAQNARDIVERMDDGGAAFKKYYLSQLLEEGQPLPQKKKGAGQYLGTGTLRSSEPVEDGISPQPSWDSGWEEMSEKDRKKAIKAVTKQNRLQEAEARKAEKEAKKKEKDMQKQLKSGVRQESAKKPESISHRGFPWWKRQSNPDPWPDWEGSDPVQEDVPQSENDDENEVEQQTGGSSRDEGDDLRTHASTPKEEHHSGRRLPHFPRLRRSLSSLVGSRGSNDETWYDAIVATNRPQSLDNRFGEIDLDKRAEDRKSLILRAQRNSQATISEVDQAVLNKTGKAPSHLSSKRGSWVDKEPPQPEGADW